MESNLILYTNDSGDVSIQSTLRRWNFLAYSKTNGRVVQCQNEGTRQVTREVAFYPLDAIIAVGYRVNSEQATYFRKWATKVLNSFITKGYVLDKQRLKQGEQFGHDYFILLSAKLLGKSLTCCHPNYCVSMSWNEDFYV